MIIFMQYFSVFCCCIKKKKSILLLYEKNRVPLEEKICAKGKIKLTRYAVSLNVQSKLGGGVKENYFLSIFHSQTIL